MPPTSRNTIAALLGMTFVTGLIDAASVLGLGHVFVANMTGNLVFIGFSLFTHGGVSLGAAAVALASFLLGALLGGRMIKKLGARGPQGALVFEVGLLLVAGVSAVQWGSVHSLVLIAPLALAMGSRTAVIRALAIPDLTTTVLTLTVTGIAADSSLAGGSNPRLGRRALSIAAMLAGASLGALLIQRLPAYVLLIAALLEALAAALLIRSLAAPATPGGAQSPHTKTP
jgi:uncharacterized membrane protein YoaK (UPF0700 family)